MKTRHIIAIGLLSALAIGILGLAIHTNKAKPKTMVNADTSTTYLLQVNETNPIQADCTLYTNFYGPILITHTDTSTTLNIANFYIRYFQILNNGSIWDTTIAEDSDAFEGYWTTTTSTTWSSNVKIKNIAINFNNFTLDVDNEKIAYATFNIYINYENQHLVWEIYHAQYLIEINDDYSNSATFLLDAYEQSDIRNTYIYVNEAEIYNYPYEEGYTAGESAGYDTGYGIGYNDSEAFNHPIDIAGTMLQVLTMPFTFISQAFDVTLWPGTQYQINIGNFIKAMLAISAILFIIRLFTTGFSIIGNYSANIQNHKLTKQKIAESKARTNLINRTDPNHKTKSSVNINHNYKHKD